MTEIVQCHRELLSLIKRFHMMLIILIDPSCRDTAQYMAPLIATYSANAVLLLSSIIVRVIAVVYVSLVEYICI